MSKDDVVILGAGNPLLAPVDVLERVRPWLLDAIRRYQLGQPVSYTLWMNLLPGPDGNPAPRTLFYLEIPNPILGQPPISHTHICHVHVAQPEVDEICKGIIEALMNRRSEALSLQNGQPPR